MSEIINGLWLCSWEEAKTIIPILKLPLVINCTKSFDFITENTIRIPIDDDPNYIPFLNSKIFGICKNH